MLFNSGGAGSHGPLNLGVAFRHAQDDDASVGELAADGDEGVGAICAGQVKIHQGDVGAMAPEFRNCLRGIVCLSDHQHVGLQTDDRVQSFTNDGMILNAQDANGVGPDHDTSTPNSNGAGSPVV
jgi:hypothetical protein